VVRRGHDAFNRQDLDAALEFADPDFEWHPAFGEALLGASVYRGHEGFKHYFEQVHEVLEGFRVEPLKYSTFRDYVVVQGKVSGRGRASGVAIETEMTIVWRLRDGRGMWGATYFGRGEALRAIGAREEDLEPAG
jgi:ketosteroid isomerase-like protein